MVISENIVTAFSGQIGVKSRFGKGTQFTFSLMLGKSDLQENQVVAENNKKQIGIHSATSNSINTNSQEKTDSR